MIAPSSYESPTAARSRAASAAQPRVPKRNRLDDARLDVERERVEPLAARRAEPHRSQRATQVSRHVQERRQVPRDDPHPVRVGSLDEPPDHRRRTQVHRLRVVRGLEDRASARRAPAFARPRPPGCARRRCPRCPPTSRAPRTGRSCRRAPAGTARSAHSAQHEAKTHGPISVPHRRPRSRLRRRPRSVTACPTRSSSGSAAGT